MFSKNGGQGLKQTDNRTFFIENKGQVSDQFNKPRPDVLYSGNLGDLIFHIKKNGISYQLSKIESFKEEKIKKFGGKELVPDKISVYRIDVNWINFNKNFKVEKSNVLPGHNNYYYEVCPNGIIGVKSFKNIKLKNVFNNIDLHYYEKDGVLKYDYIVAPYANYKNIRFEIKGAKIKLNGNGGLFLQTPFGTIEEGAPVAFQKGKELESMWKVENDILSFEIPNYDPNIELIIDPPTRVWGRYYGGSGNESESFCATDRQGDIYLCGITSTTLGTSIATVGSFQNSYGGNNSDAFVAKFNTNGVRQWGTYYGGSGIDVGQFCIADTLNNLYICGQTSSTNAIASPGAHQATYGGSNYDAFLVKFNSSTGTRQWGTYYGDVGGEYGYACAVSPSGNDVYLTGLTTIGSGGTVIATSGCHQPTYGGNSMDAYLVKFNSNGIRQWGTFYGGTGNDVSYSAACDTYGNVYLCGETGGGTATVIATPASYQPSNGGNTDAFLAKFDPSGTRIWGTFYGGTSMDYGYSCAVDAFDNVFLVGDGNSTSGLASPGSYQSTIGSSQLPFLVRFNKHGQRFWGTYYGGTAAGTAAFYCTTDRFGNVYFTGRCNPTANISTPGSHQPVSGGGVDAFIVKFDSTGTRKWGTFYGGTNSDWGTSCAVDTMRNIYLTGYTSSNSSAISTLTIQPYGGGDDSYIAKFNECTTFTANVSQTNVKCFGYANGSATISPSGPGYTYLWSPTNATSQAVSSLAPGNYTATATNSCYISSTSTLQITEPPVLTLTASIANASVCPGSPTTLFVNTNGGTGTITYSWSNGANTLSTIINPTVPTTYSVQVSDIYLCSNSATVSVGTYSIPTVSVNSGSICSGNSFTLLPSGASTYTFSSGSSIVSPTSTASFSVLGTSSNGCVSNSPAIGTVTVYSLPILNISGPSGICFGNSALLSSSGALTYTWNGSIISSSINVSPISTMVYTVVGINSNGCTNTSTISLTVFTLPNISISGSNQLCNGSQSFIYASGANTYTWNTNATTTGILVQPSSTSSFSVFGVDANGCSNFATHTITVLPSPTISAIASQSSVCNGNSVTLNGVGAVSYSWTGGAINNSPFFPTLTGTYTVMGSDINGCQNSASVIVVVNPSPNLVISASNQTICSKESTTLSVIGANSYTWSTSANAQSIIVSPTITTIYTVAGSDINGCTSSSFLTIIVDPCVGIKSIDEIFESVQIFPNPSEGEFLIKIPNSGIVGKLEIYSPNGKLVFNETLRTEQKINITSYSSGIYLLRIYSDGRSITYKLIKQ